MPGSVQVGDAYVSLGLNFAALTAGFAAAQMATEKFVGAIDGILEVGILGTLAGVGLPAAGAFIVGSKAAAEFQATLTNVANNTNMTSAQMQTMSDTILEMGRTTSAPLDQLATGYMHITNMGFGAADATKILNAAMESAVSTGTDVGATANVLANVLHEFGLSADQSAASMDQLHTAAALGNLTLEQMVNSFGPVAAIASTVGLKLDEVASAESALTRHGFDAAEASTQLKNMIERIAAPSAGATKEIALLSKTTGVDLTRDFSQAGLATLGLTGVLEDIAKATHGNVQAFTQLTGATAPTVDQLNQLQAASNGDLAAIKGLEPNIRGLYAAFILTGRGAGDYLDILRQVDASTEGAGITAESYVRKQETVAFQLAVFKNNLQIASIELGQNFLPILTRTLEWVNGTGIPIVEALASLLGTALTPAFQAVGSAIASVGAALQSGGLAGALQQILVTVGNVASQMFAAGWNLVQQLGSGIVQAAGAIITEAANYVSQLIADFLIGFSPPKKGPLTQIKQGGVNLMASYAEGLKAGTQPIVDIATDVGTKFQALLAMPFASAKDAIKGMADAGGQLTAQLVGVNAQIQEITYNQSQAKFQADGIKASYDAQIQPLQDALDALKGQVDYTNQIADANDRVERARLQQKLLADQGDPVKRAQFQAQLDSLRAQQSELDVQSQIDNLEAKKKASAGDPEKLAALNLKLQELGIQRQMSSLVDKPQLATDKAAVAKLDADKSTRDAAQAVIDAQRKQAELGLQKQIDEKKEAEKKALEPVTQQLEGYKQQLAVLTLQKNELTDLKGLLQASAAEMKAVLPAGGAGGAHLPKGGAGGAGLPHPAPPSGPKPEDAIKDAMTKAADDFVDSMHKKGEEAAKKFTDGLKEHLKKLPEQLEELGTALIGWVENNGPPLLVKLGALVEQVGAWVIGTGTPALLKHLEAWGTAFVAWVEPFIPLALAKMGDLLSQLGGWIHTTAPVVGAQLLSWGQAFVDWVGPQIPRVLAALGDLLSPLGAWITKTALPTITTQLLDWGGAFVSWVLPQIPRVLGMLASLLGSLGNWIVTTALPAIGTQLLAWGQAFVAWVVPAISNLRDNLGPMLDMLGSWIFDTAVPLLRGKLMQWGEAFMQWVAPAIPPLIVELAKLLVEVAGWLIFVAEPKIVEKLLEWSKAFSDWVSPRIVILLGELASLLGSMTYWILNTAVPDVLAAMVNVGVAVVTGFVQGIKQVAGQVNNAIKGVITSGIAQAKTDLGIASPSTVFSDIGTQTMQGFIDGATGALPLVQTAMDANFKALNAQGALWGGSLGKQISDAYNANLHFSSAPQMTGMGPAPVVSSAQLSQAASGLGGGIITGADRSQAAASWGTGGGSALAGLSTTLESHAAGGIVGGAYGEPRLIIAHGGEEVRFPEVPSMSALLGNLASSPRMPALPESGGMSGSHAAGIDYGRLARALADEMRNHPTRAVSVSGAGMNDQQVADKISTELTRLEILYKHG